MKSPTLAERPEARGFHRQSGCSAGSERSPNGRDGLPAPGQNEPTAISEQEFAAAFQTGFRFTTQFLRSRGLPPERAEECAQAAWAKGWECRRQLLDRERVTSWVNTIAYNLFRNECRRPAFDELPPAATSRTPDLDHRIDAERALSSCPDLDRRILEQYHFEGRNSREIGRLSGISSGAVRIRLMRARRRLLAAIEGKATASPA